LGINAINEFDSGNMQLHELFISCQEEIDSCGSCASQMDRIGSGRKMSRSDPPKLITRCEIEWKNLDPSADNKLTDEISLRLTFIPLNSSQNFSNSERTGAYLIAAFQ
jgi:hypothetical protein